jgi:hypothetical protein
MYRVSYAVGTSQQRRVTRSLAIFDGASERRLWNGEVVQCLDFTRPHGRSLSLLSTQLVEARPATLNERGQLILVDRTSTRRRRTSRRRLAF